ncbi:hypothetical protein J2T15_006118 [Paenibacillus harenae]|uniref:Uncharacterized protein n=1 Tax=Paenibacillus harenae TaxID=306543 RepID=A0ABT9UCD5_PAEHA|nr:hypothetical protein [Paenibacillus harenae]
MPGCFYFGKSRRNGNARTFFLVAVISTVAFSAIVTLYGFQSFLTAGLSTSSPNTFTYYADDNEEQDVALINETLQEEHIKANKNPVFKSVAVIGLLYRLGQRLRKTPCPG